MKLRILLVNPPIYDFAAHDFWLKPYGMLSVAGYLRGRADFVLFDYLDRSHAFYTDKQNLRSDEWGRGRFYEERIVLPAPLKDIPRYFRRFGLPREFFRQFIAAQNPCDFVFIQTMMTWWYPGVAEVIEDVRMAWPDSRIILGGNYVTLCKSHAETSGANLLIEAHKLEPLWQYLRLAPDSAQPALWEVYSQLKVGVLKLTAGCPFKCTYCSVPKVRGGFAAVPIEQALAELDMLVARQVRDIAFYDDALLFDAENVIVPFLDAVLSKGIRVNFHTPNGLNARFLTKDLAALMVRAGFKTFYLGFESSAAEWQKATGSKVFSDELASAVSNLKAAGANPHDITAYQILGHPFGDKQQLEESMRFVASLGIRGMLADFSPVPGTPDGDYCGRWVDMNEPLMHNKTAFPIILLGFDEYNRLKDLQRQLNRLIVSH